MPLDKSKQKPTGLEVDDFTWDRMTRSEREIMHSFDKAYPKNHKSIRLNVIDDLRTGQRIYNPNLSPEERASMAQSMNGANAEIAIVNASPEYNDQ